MNKNMISLIFTLSIIGCFVVIKRMRQTASAAQYTIGIIQTASHPALDAVREGFMQELSHQLGDKVAYVVQNVQGSVAQAHGAAQQFHADTRYNAFFTIATPATQAMVAIEHTRPIIIAAVTDPTALGLMQYTNVTGVSDMIDIAGEIDMALQLVPTAQTVGLLYTSGEPNSLVLAKHMRRELEARGRTVTDFTISNESDVAAITALACRKVDLIIAPTDNTVASAIALIASIAITNKKPLVVSDNMLVSCGPLAARGIDYADHGKHAARVAHAVVIEGKNPADLPIEQTRSNHTYINQATLTTLELTIPAALQTNSTVI